MIIDGESKNLFDWRDAAVIDLQHDKYWGYWEFQVVAAAYMISQPSGWIRHIACHYQEYARSTNETNSE